MSIFLQMNQKMKRTVQWIAYLTMAVVANTLQKQTNPQKNILVYGSALLGDFIMSLPALKLLRTTYPSHRIILLSKSSASMEQLKKASTYTGTAFPIPWLEFAHPHLIDESIVIENSHPKVLWDDIRPHIRQLNPEHCFLLKFYAAPRVRMWKQFALLRLLGVSCSIPGRWKCNPLASMRDSQYHAGAYRHHVIGRLQSVMDSNMVVSLKTINIAFDVRLSASALDTAAGLWLKHDLLGKTVVAIAPGAIRPHKQWPIQKFEKVCEYLLQQDDAAIIVVGMPGHSPLGERLSKISPARIINLAGKHSIMEVAAILQHCALLVGNDGGAMHLGDALGCRVLSIVPGIEYPFSIEPWHNIHNAVRFPVPCAPCYDYEKCPEVHNRCMVDLPVADVVRKISQMLILHHQAQTSASSYPCHIPPPLPASLA